MASGRVARLLPVAADVVVVVPVGAMLERLRAAAAWEGNTKSVSPRSCVCLLRGLPSIRRARKDDIGARILAHTPPGILPREPLVGR